MNNPVKYTDPSGHYIETAIDVAFLAMDINDIRTGNANKWTYIGLGVDLVCAALPVATGGRLAVTAVEETVTHADNVGDLFKLLDKTAGVEKKIDGTTDAEKTVNNLDSFADAVRISKNPYKWGNPKTLQRHFKDHGADFGARTEDEYATMANDFFNNGKRYETKIDDSGVIRIYDPKTNTFGSYNPDGTTRTFYKPTAGVDYWKRQPGIERSKQYE